MMAYFEFVQAQVPRFLVMRSDVLLKPILNVRIFSSMQAELKQDKGAVISVIAENNMQTYLIMVFYSAANL